MEVKVIITCALDRESDVNLVTCQGCVSRTTRCLTAVILLHIDHSNHTDSTTELLIMTLSRR